LGEVWLTLDGGLDHAMNICITGDSGVLEVRFIESQVNAYGFKLLQRTELETIRLIKI
jgi:hypothetical protein